MGQKMKIIKIHVGYLQTNCYIVFDEAARHGIIVDPGDDAERIIGAVNREELKILAVINTHGHFDHIGANSEVLRETGAELFSPENDGQEKTFGTLKLKFFFTPGHTGDGISFLIGNHLFAGDTLFAGSVGRTDLGDGDMELLIDSIKTKLLTLPEHTIVHPGHGPDTTIENEAKNNPFL
jgi:glyoxylase-like metal-dependent hydrolase (beta-lactamase superfamily II)